MEISRHANEGGYVLFPNTFLSGVQKEGSLVQGLSHPELLLGEKQKLVLILLLVILLSIPPGDPTYL